MLGAASQGRGPTNLMARSRQDGDRPTGAAAPAAAVAADDDLAQGTATLILPDDRRGAGALMPSQPGDPHGEPPLDPATPTEIDVGSRHGQRRASPSRREGRAGKPARSSSQKPDGPPTRADGGSDGSDGSERSESSRGRPSRPPESVSTRGTAAPTAQSTLHVGEIQRTRVFLRIAIATAVAVAASVPLLGGDRVAKVVLVAGLAVVAGPAAWLLHMMRDDAGYTPERATPVGFASVVGALAGIYYFGVFSPAAVVLPFGLYFFGLAQGFGVTLGVYLVCAVGYGAMGAGIASGLLADRGLIGAAHLTPAAQLVVLVLVEVIVAATYVLARATRRAEFAAIEQHDRVVRGIAHREALLKEARDELVRALAAGGVGRYSEQVIGSFRLGAVLGRGAMGEIYEAVHVKTGEEAAVKLLLPHLLASPETVRRFLREAQLASAVKVPHVVRVLEVGGIEADVPFIAMERLAGADLASHLRRRKRLSVRRVLKLTREVGAGLAATREVGIVHRDLKPQNVFLAEGGDGTSVWKILDFGVSKLGTGKGTLTQDRLVGTPAYMAPEQARGGDVAHRADLYSLAVIAYRALTGRPAFAGKDLPETLYNVVYTMPPAPSDILALHPDFDLALAVGMAKDEAARFERVEELVEALDEASAGELSESVRARGRAALERHPWGWRGPAT